MDKHPEHKASFEFPGDHYQVIMGSHVIADTRSAILLKESHPKGSLPPVLYFPLKDTHQDFLVPTEHHTFCPLKGEASYYSLQVDGQTLENVAWYYAQPLQYVSEIVDCLASYSDKVDIRKVTN